MYVILEDLIDKLVYLLRRIQFVSSFTPDVPLEIWLDSLEDEGMDTRAMRMWVKYGIISVGCGLSIDWYIDGNGHGDPYGDGDSGSDEFVS